MANEYIYDVSIIIVSYNMFNVLNDCLKTLSAFSEEFSYEVIIIDNNSTEKNIEEVLDGYSNVTLIKNNINMGYGAANNQGIKIAKGKYLLFLNNDALFTENAIKKIFDYAETNETDTFIGCKLLNADGTHQESIYEYESAWNNFTENFFLYKLFPRSKLFNKYSLNQMEYDGPAEVDAIKGAFIFAKESSIKALNGFDERFFFYWEEMELCYRFTQGGGKVIYYPGTSIIHLGGASSSIVPWFACENRCKAKIQFFQKHLSGISFYGAVISHYVGLIMRVPLYFIIALFSGNKFMYRKSWYYLRLLFIYPRNMFNND